MDNGNSEKEEEENTKIQKHPRAWGDALKDLPVDRQGQEKNCWAWIWFTC